MCGLCNGGGGGGGGVFELEELEVWTRRLLTSSVRVSILAVSEATTASRGEVGVNGSAMRIDVQKGNESTN